MFFFRLKVKVKLKKPFLATWKKSTAELETVYTLSSTSRKVVGVTSSDGF